MWSLGHLRSIQTRVVQSFGRIRLSTATRSQIIQPCLTLPTTNTTLPSTLAAPIRTFSSTPSDSEHEHERQELLSSDHYSAEKMAALEKKYQWVDWNAMAHHIHMSDVHFFDQEVPYVDSDFTIKRDMNLEHRLQNADRLTKIQTAEDKKIKRLLHFGYWVTQGRHVRVTSHGKVSSVWTMVIAGDLNGTASYGIGKGKDMVEAEKLALQDLPRNMLFVPLFESRTISHEITGKHGSCSVRVWPRTRERGITGGMIPRMIFRCFGLRDATASISGRALPHHQVRAMFDGLSQVKSAREEAIRRGVTVHRMYERGLQERRPVSREQQLINQAKVSEILHRIQARMVQQGLIKDKENQSKGSSEKSQDSWKPPEWESVPKEERSTENIFVPSHIDRKPQPMDVGSHGPAPPHPTGRKPQFKERLFEQRGLPHPKTPLEIDPKKVL